MPRWQRALAVFQMVGGIACIAGAFHHFSADSEGVALRVFVIPVFAGALAAIAGFLVAVRDTFGIWLSFLIQAAQVLSYNIGWNYLYVTGPKVVSGPQQPGHRTPSRCRWDGRPRISAKRWDLPRRWGRGAGLLLMVDGSRCHCHLGNRHQLRIHLFRPAIMARARTTCSGTRGWPCCLTSA